MANRGCPQIILLMMFPVRHRKSLPTTHHWFFPNILMGSLFQFALLEALAIKHAPNT